MKQQPILFSIRWKLLTIMICLLVSVLAVSTYLQVSNQKKFYVDELGLRIHLIKEKLISKGWTLSGHLSRQVENGLATVNLSQISEILKKSVDEDNELHYAVLTDNSARVYIHTLKPEMELEVFKGFKKDNSLQNKPHVFEHSDYGVPVLEFQIPIEISTKQWGILQLGFNLDLLNQEAAEFEQDNKIKIQTMIERSIFAVCFFILGSIIIILILSDRLSRPLIRLTRAANKLAAGDFTASDNILINSKDEIGVLARAFNDMSQELSSSYFKLQNYNLSLEQQVEERTFELARARDEAVKANQSKSNFLSMVSHEIRTPMNAIIGLTQLSLKTGLSPKQHEYLTSVKNSADSLMVIINDLLDISKIEAGKLSIEEVNFNLESVLITLKNVIKIKAEEKNLDLHFFIADKVPHTLNGDPLRLGQILLNLVSNAIKFTESGSIAVNIELIEKKDTTLMLQFSVKDSGIGLTEKQIKSLFKAYTQADISTTRLYGGTGLGLFICRQLVELMGGTISVKSKPNEGSEFIFTVGLNIFADEELRPRKKANNLIIDAPEYTNTNTNISTKTKTNTSCKILVVDDYSINLEVAKALLEDQGFDVSIAESGQKAIQMVKETIFDLILMDLKMPGLDGLETTRLIRTTCGYSDLPIIALSAQATDDEVSKCKNQGMTDFVSKPIDIDQLVLTLKQYISCDKIEQNQTSVKGTSQNVTNPIKLNLTAINVQEGINRVGGQHKFYYQLLSQFEDQFTDAMLQINSCIQAGNKLLAEQLTHALKGVSANISANQLSDCVGKLESALIKQQDDLKNLIDHCDFALNQVLLEIKTIQSLLSENSENFDLKNDSDIHLARVELTNLSRLLKLNRLDVDLTFETLKTYLDSTQFAIEIESLGQFINVFDFSNALLTSQEILKKLEKDQYYSPIDASQQDNKQKILIVDDIQVNIKMLAAVLRDQYIIQIATNGRDAALIATAEHQPDLILMDIEMPDMNGYELCLKLKENSLTKKIPVIFITGRTEVIDEKIGLAMGAVDYITKPFNTSVVQARVNSHMESKLRADKLEQLASLDGLTGIPNRRQFNELMQQEWKRASRTQKPLSLIFIDIDFFKQFNDFYGHTVGDQCLCIVSKVLKKSLKRNSDFLARYGGEEFIIILPETDNKAALIIAETIRFNVENLKLPHMPVNGFKSVTLSLGVATMIPARETNPSDLVQAADTALYKAKSNGRNQVK